MVEFVPASQARPNLSFALRNLRIAVKENPKCSRHMLQGVVQLLQSIYHLMVNDDADRFVQPSQSNFERKIQRLERWVIQWEQRYIIDNAVENVRLTFWDTVRWTERQDVCFNAQYVQEYVNEEDLINNNPNNVTVPQIIREAVQQD
jgi:hypothetical protein